MLFDNLNQTAVSRCDSKNNPFVKPNSPLNKGRRVQSQLALSRKVCCGEQHKQKLANMDTNKNNIWTQINTNMDANKNTKKTQIRIF